MTILERVEAQHDRETFDRGLVPDVNEPVGVRVKDANGYAEIPGEIDASQYDPAHFQAPYEQIPDEGTPLP